MTLKVALAAVAALAATFVFVWRPAFADEGIWTFDHFPADQLERAYGVKIDRAWLDRVQASSVRFSNNCSASLVSGDGLVFSAQHCVASCVQGLSTANNDYMRDGFAAAGREDERKCPGIQAEIVLSISDVSGAVKNAAAGTARDGVIAGIEDAACGKNPRLRCEVVSYYSGGQFKLYMYRRYSDVRLVFAPEYSMASFGGDPDNFNFPRYGMDVSFVRLYDNGKPVKTPQHLDWVNRPPKSGD